MSTFLAKKSMPQRRKTKVKKKSGKFRIGDD